MARLFFKYSGSQLSEVFDNSKNDPDQLKILLEELSHRSTDRMIHLRKQVEKQLRHLESFSPPQSFSSILPSQAQTSSSKPSTSSIVSPPLKKRVLNTPLKYKDPFPQMNSVPTDVAQIRPSGNINGVPSKFQFALKTDVKLKLDDSLSLSQKYEMGLKALIAEMKKDGAGTKQITLEDGLKVSYDGQDVLYQFPYDGEAELFEGARVQLKINNICENGEITAIYAQKIILKLQKDLGIISHCLLIVDNTAMLEALRNRLEKISLGEVPKFNTSLAESTINNQGSEGSAMPLPESQTTSLNIKQCEAVCKIMSNSVFYLWGPPGTGKTKTLGAVCHLLFEKGKKVLLCSNTNQAVDQVLLKLCKEFGTSHRALFEGEILRIGSISLPELKDDWSAYVTIEGISGRKSADLKAQQEELEQLRDELKRRSEKLSAIVTRFEELDDLESKRDKEKKLGIQRVEDAKQEKKKAEIKLDKLRLEQAKIQKGGFWSFFYRSIDSVKKDIREISFKVPQLSQKIVEAQSRVFDFKKLEPNLFTLKEQLQCYERSEIEKEAAVIEEQFQNCTQEISKIKKALKEISLVILADAKIVGATVTKTYLSPQMFDGFDVVIVDEASMVMLPALYAVVGLAQEKVLISGDFRQLSPIIQSKQKEIFEAIGGNIFKTSGLVGAFQEGSSLKRTVMLNEQYRMDESICKLISSRMYQGKLQTSASRKGSTSKPAPPFHQVLTLVDTSTIFPFSNKDLFKSRYNLMHVLAIRNLCLHLQEQRFLDTNSVGICTPYAAQSKLLKKILKGSKLEGVDAGTVHYYQGGEKSMMVLDIPDSLGDYYSGIFLQADDPEEDGAKLFNVAMSRAENHLVVFANLDFLDRKLPQGAMLRNILAEIQEQGTVLDVRDVLRLHPILEDLKQYGEEFNLSVKTEETGLFNQKDFEVVCQADLSRAEKSIVVFSGFITEQRVAKYESIFRSKIAEGVKIRCVTRPPDRNGSISVASGQLALNALEGMGCVVDTRGNIHEKALIIDEKIVWFGSLNPLSHTAQTAEVMARIEGHEIAEQLITFLSVTPRARNKSTDGLFTSKENPECPVCNARTAYMVGKFGPYWDCEECTWRESVAQNSVGNRKKAGTKGASPTTNFPPCPKCGKTMTSKSGRYGAFYGCSDYPVCKGTKKIEK